MTGEKSNAVLEEQIRQLRKELNNHRVDTRERFVEVQLEMKELEKSVDSAQKVADQVHLSMQYVTQAVNEMKGMVQGFTQLISSHNERIDGKLNEQNTKIDSFINSDSRRNSKRQFIVSILQVGAGILATVLGFWASGKL